MKRINRILLTIGFIGLFMVSWAVVLGAKSDIKKQSLLTKQASEYLSDEVFVLAVPLLEEAISYNTKNTYEVESELKKTYRQLINQREYLNKYLSLLEKQMESKDAMADVFLETAEFYLDRSQINNALNVLKDGITKTGSEELMAIYEKNRYLYRMGYNTYEDVTAIYGTTIGVKKNELWGLAISDGTLVIPCEYEKISSYSNGRVIVQKDSIIYAVNSANNRLALLKEEVIDFGNFANKRISLLTNDGWVRATEDFVLGSMVFEDMGTYSGGYVAVKQNNKWGIIDTASKWLIAADYDGIILDELGRAYGQGAVFMKTGNSINLFVDGVKVGDTYEDAQPFGNEGYAAVKKGGKWGFIDTSGEVKIDYQFDEALSFGQHLAVVRQGELWGYVGLDGNMAIDPVFLQAKSFANGSAPVLTEEGWQFITLIEFEKGVSL